MSRCNNGHLLGDGGSCAVCDYTAGKGSDPQAAPPAQGAYEHSNGRIFQEFRLGTGNRLQFAAENIRRERTGVHATLGISMNGKALAWDYLNVERHGDRVRLANAAYKQLDELDGGVWPENQHRRAFDLFAYGLWGEHIKAMIGGPLEGDPNAGPPETVCGSYAIDGGGCIIYSPPGKGKSYTALSMAISMDAGAPLIWPVKQRKCLYLNLERSAVSMRHRLARINAGLGLDPRRPLTFINARGRPLGDLVDVVAETMIRHGCEVLIVDSISRTGMGDLTDATAANRIIDTLNNLSPTWLALGHTPRSDDTHVFGSVHFTAGADVEVRLLSQSQNGTTGIGLQVTKANDLPKVPMFVFALDWENAGLKALRPATLGEFPELASGKERSLGEEVAEYLGAAGAATATETAKELGRARQGVATLLSRDPRFVRVRKDGKDVLYGLKVEVTHG